MEQGLEDLCKIDLIESSHVGRAVPSPREVVDDSFDYSLLLYFKNKENHDVYQVHPDHDVFIEKCAALWDQVKVYDTSDA